MNGRHWCGQYTSPFKKTICNTAENINPALCRSDIGIKVTDCESPIMNPQYPGRAGPASLWDTKCTKTITLGYDNGNDLVKIREANHNVIGSKFCLITINNLSGADQNITVSNIQSNDLKVYKLDNTDQIWWMTLPTMEIEKS